MRTWDSKCTFILLTVICTVFEVPTLRAMGWEFGVKVKTYGTPNYGVPVYLYRGEDSTFIYRYGVTCPQMLCQWQSCSLLFRHWRAEEVCMPPVLVA
jgi:hypothetical protein